MRSGREFLKRWVIKTCSPRLQHKIRRFYVASQLVRRQYYHEPEMAVLNLFIAAGDFVADIGANVGVYTKALSALVGPQGQVYAFEPIPENHDILTTVICKAHLCNVSSFRGALGSQRGQCEMVLPELGGFAAYYWAHIAQTGDPGRREIVEVFTLDGLWQQQTIRPLDFIKCDVEGSELEVIRGGLGLIQAHRPGWLIEVSREASGEVFQLFKGLGYRAFVWQGNRLVPTERYRDREFSNYFFFHPESEVYRRLLPYLQS